MKLNPPFSISSRLLPSLKIGGAEVQLQYSKCSDPFRQGYRWTIDLPNGSRHCGNKMASGHGGGGLQAGFSALLSFLGACAESMAYKRRTGRGGENCDLFPAAVAEWADQNSDKIAMMAIEVEETKNLIEE